MGRPAKFDKDEVIENLEYIIHTLRTGKVHVDKYDCSFDNIFDSKEVKSKIHGKEVIVTEVSTKGQEIKFVLKATVTKTEDDTLA